MAATGYMNSTEYAQEPQMQAPPGVGMAPLSEIATQALRSLTECHMALDSLTNGPQAPQGTSLDPSGLVNSLMAVNKMAAGLHQRLAEMQARIGQL